MSTERERERLAAAASRTAHWRRWGTFLSARQWGTVREDYSPGGTAWEYFPHDHARSRAYRWGEDGLLGWCDNHQRLIFSIALWNGRDPILKERLFGLTGNEGNHGEDVKELYYYLDAVPTHAYCKGLYKYPQAAYPYEELLRGTRERGRGQGEYELLDTGAFHENRYFDVFVEYAKADVDDTLIRLTVVNRGPSAATVHLLPQFWFRNTWAWQPGAPRPTAIAQGAGRVRFQEQSLGDFTAWWENQPDLLFTENDTNTERLYGHASGAGRYKDAFDRYVVHGERDRLSNVASGTKCAGLYEWNLQPGETRTVRLRLARTQQNWEPSSTFDEIVQQRISEADAFYEPLAPADLSADARLVQRQAWAGLLWCKQFFYYVVEDWLRGDPGQPAPPPERLNGRNHDWRHVYDEDVLSMPDNWEYPWFAAWDTAFHCIAMAPIDPDYAKEQLGLLLREWYMHPNGQIPAYEWAFGDVNPPVHAWSCWRVFKIDAKLTGQPDYTFLKRVFHKLMINFTWWVNRKDEGGNNIFQGGFLGMDNVGPFDRSAGLPGGATLDQSDGTSWMAMYCLNLLRIALELAQVEPVYEDIASKFFEHFLQIGTAINQLGGHGLFDEGDGFYYDQLVLRDGERIQLKARSMVGLIPLFAVEVLDADLEAKLPSFHKRAEWFRHHRPDLSQNITFRQDGCQDQRTMLAIVPEDRLRRLLDRVLDEAEFLSPYGIRSLSRIHAEHPFAAQVDGQTATVGYEPAESQTGLFGGNSNWRGPLWFPTNYLLIESLQKLHYFYGDDFTVEFPRGSGQCLHLSAIAAELSRRLARLFLRGEDGRRPVFGSTEHLQNDPQFRDYILFYEYFHGDNGAGLGASHQTGWTALVAKLLQQSGE